jgi:hypothetical protein
MSAAVSETRTALVAFTATVLRGSVAALCGWAICPALLAQLTSENATATDAEERRKAGVNVMSVGRSASSIGCTSVRRITGTGKGPCRTGEAKSVWQQPISPACELSER